jgi:membrane-bound ClpP family serine protease
MVILGLILIVLGLVVPMHILFILGIILLVVGLLLGIGGTAGYTVGNRRHWW